MIKSDIFFRTREHCHPLKRLSYCLSLLNGALLLQRRINRRNDTHTLIRRSQDIKNPVLLFWRWISMHISEMFPRAVMLQRLTLKQMFLYSCGTEFCFPQLQRVTMNGPTMQSLLPKTYSTKLGNRMFIHKERVWMFLAVTFNKYAMTDLVLMPLYYFCVGYRLRLRLRRNMKVPSIC